MSSKVLQLDAKDNVLIALVDLSQGEQILFDGSPYALVYDVPAKHKFAIRDLAVGADVIMYGVLVATATKAIQRGERLTPLNVHHRASAIHERSGGYHWSPPDVAPWKQRTFMGYH